MKRLTEEQWLEVFRQRCRSKRGEQLAPAERTLIDAAYRQDPDRYSEMEADVFNATVPFGSTTRRKP